MKPLALIPTIQLQKAEMKTLEATLTQVPTMVEE
jgi:hypothetical protein